MKQAIPYYRVSTKRQGKSGLGLEAQQACVRFFAKGNGFEIVQEFTETESGRNNDRPVLNAALSTCQKKHAVLLIAKLDRLSRNVAFVSTLLESNVEFIDIEMPSADEFFIILKAAFAQKEAKENSKRTKAALQAAKARGVELGKNGRYVLSVRNKAAADAFALKMQSIIAGLNAHGITTIRKISKELNKRKIATFKGKNRKWHPATVHNLITRLKNLNRI